MTEVSEAPAAERTTPVAAPASQEPEPTSHDGSSAVPTGRHTRASRVVKLAVVVQRYGADINGGAELHARYIAELLARRHTVEVLTTCAHDYVTWRDEYPAGDRDASAASRCGASRVARERDPEEFGRRSTLVFESRALDRRRTRLARERRADEPGAGRRDRAHAPTSTTGSCSSAIATTTRITASAAVAPQGDPRPDRRARRGARPVDLRPIFRGVRAIMYNSHEERAMIQAASGNRPVPGVVVGVGSEVPRETVAERFRRKHDIR